MTLIKSRFINAIAEQNGFTKKNFTETIEIIPVIVKSSFESGEDTLVSGFGKFCVKDKRERRSWNPDTGEGMELEPQRVVTFRC